jgi:hypothetical protein
MLEFLETESAIPYLIIIGLIFLTGVVNKLFNKK